ncbi:unnamed protein product [Prorocentrum cordatum]|uniref:BRCT domain-containing protein n=1 Tax=Prorocentrum cordatum TaxID=2364126 RepID=A0ABN9RQD7_9DINO|nr:unnamed protein product [Polarella glacialis]
MPPGVQRQASGTKCRRDYFDSQVLVMKHVYGAGAAERLSSSRGRRGVRGAPSGRPARAPPSGDAKRRRVSVARGADAVARRPAEARQYRPLQGWVVMLTGFGPEEGSSELRALSLQCGASVAERLPARPPQGGLLAVVACRGATTVKFLTALALGLPPVARGWLDATALARAPAAVEPHALALRGRGGGRGPCTMQPGPRRCFEGREPPLAVHVLGSRGFVATWCGVLRLAGAEVHATWPCQGCRYVLAEAAPVRVSAAEAARLRGCGASVVGLGWLKESLALQAEAPAGAHELALSVRGQP